MSLVVATTKSQLTSGRPDRKRMALISANVMPPMTTTSTTRRLPASRTAGGLTKLDRNDRPAGLCQCLTPCCPSQAYSAHNSLSAFCECKQAGAMPPHMPVALTMSQAMHGVHASHVAYKAIGTPGRPAPPGRACRRRPRRRGPLRRQARLRCALHDLERGPRQQAQHILRRAPAGAPHRRLQQPGRQSQARIAAGRGGSLIRQPQTAAKFGRLLCCGGGRRASPQRAPQQRCSASRAAPQPGAPDRRARSPACSRDGATLQRLPPALLAVLTLGASMRSAPSHEPRHWYSARPPLRPATAGARA